MKANPLVLALAATAALGLGAHAATIVNPGFDDYDGQPIADGTLLNTLTPASWTVFGDSTVIKLKTSAAGLTAQGGTYFLGVFTNTSVDHGVTQAIATTVGTEYQITYYLARQTANSAPTLTFTAFDGDGTGGTQLADNPVVVNWAQDTWQQQSVTFTADSDTTTLRFMEPKTSNSASADPFVDTVAITVVPESSAGLMGLMGISLLFLRRRAR